MENEKLKTELEQYENDYNNFCEQTTKLNLYYNENYFISKNGGRKFFDVDDDKFYDHDDEENEIIPKPLPLLEIFIKFNPERFGDCKIIKYFDAADVFYD